MMKNYRLQVIGYRLRVTGALLLLCSISTFAQYDATGETTEQVVQLRVGAEFGKNWDRQGVKLSIGEELRFNLYDAQAGTTAKGDVVDGNVGASFNRSYTTLALQYMHPDFGYIKADAGYTLRLLGDKGWSDPNEFLRHRIFFGATAQYKMRYAKVYLRERYGLRVTARSMAARYLWRFRTEQDTPCGYGAGTRKAMRGMFLPSAVANSAQSAGVRNRMVRHHPRLFAMEEPGADKRSRQSGCE